MDGESLSFTPKKAFKGSNILFHSRMLSDALLLALIGIETETCLHFWPKKGAVRTKIISPFGDREFF